MIRSRDASRTARSPIPTGLPVYGYQRVGEDPHGSLLLTANLYQLGANPIPASFAVTPVAQRLDEFRGPRSVIVRRTAFQA